MYKGITTPAHTNAEVGVPTVRVRLLQSVSLLLHQRATVAVEVEGGEVMDKQSTFLVESTEPGRRAS